MNDENKAREELEAILNQSQYQVYYQDNRNFLEIWWDNVKSWITNLLTEWLASFQASSGVGKSVFTLFLILGLGLLIVTLYLVVRTFKRKRKFRDQQPLKANDQKHWSYYNHLQEALQQETNEEYSMGTRHLFLALLLYFHDKEWLQAKIWKTNWEYYDELYKVNEQAAEHFYHLALLFDQVTYGERTMTKEQYHIFKNKVMYWLDTEETSSDVET